MLNITLRALLLGLVTCQFVPSMVMAAAERRALTAEDINAVRELSDPQLSPDGQWVAYAVRTADPVKEVETFGPEYGIFSLGRQAKRAADQLRR